MTGKTTVPPQTQICEVDALSCQLLSVFGSWASGTGNNETLSAAGTVKFDALNISVFVCEETVDVLHCCQLVLKKTGVCHEHDAAQKTQIDTSEDLILSNGEFQHQNRRSANLCCDPDQTLSEVLDLS